MKSFVVAAALMTALNSSLHWADSVFSILAGTSEPVGLAMWGLALFAIGGSLKRRAPAAPPAKEPALPEDAPVWQYRRRSSSELTRVA